MNITEYLDELLGIYMYILELKNRKYYVGITHNLMDRIDEHRNGETTNFVSKNLPFRSFYTELLKTSDRKEAIIIETNKTIELIKQYGIENVAGGKIVGDLKRRKRIYNKEFKNRIPNNKYY